MPMTRTDRILGKSHGTLAQVLPFANRAKRPDDTRAYFALLDELCRQTGIRFEIAVAQWHVETDGGQSKYWADYLNPGGLGALETLNDPGNIHYVGGSFTPRGAALAHLVHVWLYAKGEPLHPVLAPHRALDPRADAVKRAGWLGIAPILSGLDGRWAADTSYAAKIASRANNIFANLPSAPTKGSPPMALEIGDRPLRIAVGVGHANTSGGNAYEREKNAEVVNALVKLARQSEGFDVRCYTPGDGLGWFPGSLDQAVRQVVTWDRDWPVDIFQEVHHQGLGNPSIRGGFHIYPDGSGLSSVYPNPGDLDVDAREHAPEMTDINTVQGLGGTMWGSGVMSERQTGVGGQGYRLGIFAATATPGLLAHCTRILSEALTFTNPQDKAIMDRLDFAARQAHAILLAWADLAKTRLSWEGSYRIGAPTKPEVQPGKPSTSPKVIYPTGMDAATAKKAFGEVKVDGVPYHYYETGPVSALWREEGERTGMWPELVDVAKRDMDQDGVATALGFTFSNGLRMLRPEDDVEVIVVRGGRERGEESAA